MIEGFCVLYLLRCRGISAKPKQGWVKVAYWIQGCVQRQIDAQLRYGYKRTISELYGIVGKIHTNDIQI